MQDETIQEVVARDSKFVREAIKNTPVDYWVKCLDMRTGDTAVGSKYPWSAERLERRLRDGEWSEYAHDAIAPGCRAFVAPIPGKMRMISLDEMADGDWVTLDDQKGTGFVSVMFDGGDSDIGTEVDFTVLICGEDEGKWIVFTFHPGPPVSPSTVKGTHGRKIQVYEAKALGFRWAKVA